MEYKTLLTNFQRELLFSIILNMRKGKIDKKQAKKIAKVVLPAFKSESIEAFFKEIERISKYSPEISEAFVKTLEEYEKETLEEKIKIVRQSLGGATMDSVSAFREHFEI